MGRRIEVAEIVDEILAECESAELPNGRVEHRVYFGHFQAVVDDASLIARLTLDF